MRVIIEPDYENLSRWAAEYVAALIIFLSFPYTIFAKSCIFAKVKYTKRSYTTQISNYTI